MKAGFHSVLLSVYRFLLQACIGVSVVYSRSYRVSRVLCCLISTDFEVFKKVRVIAIFIIIMILIIAKRIVRKMPTIIRCRILLIWDAYFRVPHFLILQVQGLGF